jgi:hypothetical protein
MKDLTLAMKNETEDAKMRRRAEARVQDRLKRWKNDHIVIIGLDDKPEVKQQLDTLINNKLGITEEK